MTRTDSTHLSVNISIASGAATGARAVTVRNLDGGRATLPAGFTVNAGPVITSLNPAARAQASLEPDDHHHRFELPGRFMAYLGRLVLGLRDHRQLGDPDRRDVTSRSRSPSPPLHRLGARDVTVRNLDGGRATLAGAFTVNARPTLTSLAPNSRARGQTNQSIVLTGTGFQSGATVAFSGSGITVNSVTWDSATKLTISISISGGASTGNRDVTVTNPDQGSVTLGKGFKVP